MHFSRAGTEVAQALVRFLRIEVAALRQRTLPFLRLLLQSRRIGLLVRIDRTRRPAEHGPDSNKAGEAESGTPCDGHWRRFLLVCCRIMAQAYEVGLGVRPG